MTFATQPERAPEPRFLLIEDNPFHQRLVAGMVRDAFETGAAIDQAASIGDGLRYLAEQSYDCVLLDLMLPDAVGLEGLHRLMEHYPGTPVIVVSAHDDDDTAVRSVEEGAQDYLVKGEVDEIHLRRSILQAIERSGQRTSPDHPAVMFSSLQPGIPTEGLGYLDRDGNLTAVDAGLCRILGSGPEEVMGSPVPVHPADESVFAALLGTGPATEHLRVLSADGDPVPVDLHLAPVLGATGGWLLHMAPVGGAPDLDTGTAPADLGWLVVD